MRLRILTIFFTIVIVILAVSSYRNFQTKQIDSVDILSLNEDYKQILDGLEKGKEQAYLEQSYSCEIMHKEDENYDKNVMNAIKSGKILMDYEKNGTLLGKIVFSGEGDFFKKLGTKLSQQILFSYVGILLAGYLLLIIIYYRYIRPFRKLEKFAANVAKGDLESPLQMKRENYFGAFTESFDLMREELKTARENEYKANISKKELIAELSHDIKTPIATIKATCEVMRAKIAMRGEEKDSEDILNKVRVIEQKSDMIDQLMGNLFQATLEELENLKVEPIECSSLILKDFFDDLYSYDTVSICSPIPECLLFMDALRFKQVMDNVIHNSFKYAGTTIEISIIDQLHGIIVQIRDFGDGVPEEELALLTEKFYRGNNGKGKSGAGLGLYLAKYFMEHMKGELECYNDSGFVVSLFLRKA